MASRSRRTMSFAIIASPSYPLLRVWRKIVAGEGSHCFRLAQRHSPVLPPHRHIYQPSSQCMRKREHRVRTALASHSRCCRGGLPLLRCVVADATPFSSLLRELFSPRASCFRAAPASRNGASSHVAGLCHSTAVGFDVPLTFGQLLNLLSAFVSILADRFSREFQYPPAQYLDRGPYLRVKREGVVVPMVGVAIAVDSYFEIRPAEVGNCHKSPILISYLVIPLVVRE